MLHKILTAVTALAVVASLLAGAAGQAAAVSGYDSAYFGESAFLTLGPGQSGQFAVGFNNTGSTGWLTGSSSQVDLAICLPDKVTCNVTSPNAAFASNWLSSTDYATTSTSYVGPGQTGYFVYNVTVPAAAAPGTYRFNGDLALHGTASMIHPEGYYQDVQVPSVGAASKLACAANPTSLAAASKQTSTVTVTIQDALGNTVTTDNTTSVTVSQAGGKGANLGNGPDASATATAVNGVVTFTLTAPNDATKTGTDQLSAFSPTFPTLTGCTVNVTFTAAGAPASLATSLVQSQFPSGSVSSTTVNVQLKDANGVNTTATAATTVTFTVDNASICSVVSPQTISSGQGTTSTTLTLTGVPGTCTVTASATGLTSGSATATVSASGPASKLAITSNTCTNTAIAANGGSCKITVQTQDAAGNPVFGTNTIALNLFQTGTTNPCSATVTAVTPAGTTGNPATGVTTGGQSSATFTITDVKAETCDATATSTATGTASVTGTASFTGFGTPFKLTNTVSPATIPANGASTATISVCVRDVNNNKVTTSTDSIFLTKNSGGTAGTTLISSNPATASGGCASFTVRSSTLVGSDTYTATDLTNSAVTQTTATVTTTAP